MKSNFTPSISNITNQEPECHSKCNKRKEKSPESSYQSQEASLTMPQLKKMRQASMSIIRRTGRTQQNTKSTFSAYNPGFEPHNDSADLNGSNKPITSLSNDNDGVLSKSNPDVSWKGEHSLSAAAAAARTPCLGSCSDQWQRNQKPVSFSSTSETESFPTTCKEHECGEICQQRESYDQKSRVSKN